MLCYKDKCFCSRLDCTNKGCTLRITEEIEEAASRVGLPIDMADFNNGKCYNSDKTERQERLS